MLQINKIKNNILYRFHLYLHFKNKLLLTTLLQISLIFLLTNFNGSYTYCMTNENESLSEISSTSDISSVFDYDEEYIEQRAQPQLEHIRFKYSSDFENILETYMPEPIERALVPMFEDLKIHKIDDISGFDVKETPEKIKILQNVYFTERIKNEILEECLNKQTDQLFSRQVSLIKTKSQIKSLSTNNLELTQENIDLKNQIDELQRILAETLRK